MKNIKLIILLIVTFVPLCACPTLHDESSDIIVLNNSERQIGFQPYLLTASISDQDTLLRCGGSVFRIRPDTLYRLSAGVNTDWGIEMQRYLYLQILIIDSENYDKHIGDPCDTIHKYVPVLQRYQITLENLQKLNWTITYPPTQAMKDIKMYTPYE